MEEPEQEVERVARALRAAIQRAGKNLRWVEEEAGLGQDYLSQLLRGNVDIKVVQVMKVLKAIGLEPAEFFVGVYLRPAGLPAGADAREAVEAYAAARTEDLLKEIRSELPKLVELEVDRRLKKPEK